VTVLWWIGLTIVAAWVLARTRFGNWIFSSGGDPVAARNVGVPVARTKIQLFMLTSLVASAWGVMTAVALRGIQSNEGVGREFEFIIAAVVGGCLLTGGYGSVIGAAFGAMIIGMAQIGIIQSGWDSNWVYFFEGVVLVAAVMLNTAIRRRAERAR
jgi:simple sugar transport system permease protein